MFQFTIAKIHFYFKFIPMCVWGLGGGGVLNKEMELCTQMTFSSLWDKAVEAILFLRISACLFDVSIVGGSL